MKRFSLIFILLSTYVLHSQISSDSSKVHTEIQTKFGPLSFNQYCNGSSSSISFHFYFRYLDAKVDEESEAKKIESDSVIVEFVLDDKGYVTSFKILKYGLLKEFSSFVEGMFQELKTEMPKQNQPLKCNMKSGKYTIPINYRYN